MAEECALCERSTDLDSEFCDIHTSARLNLDQAYAAWNVGLGGKITFKDFLERIMHLNDTGKFAREVAQHLLKIKA